MQSPPLTKEPTNNMGTNMEHIELSPGANVPLRDRTTTLDSTEPLRKNPESEQPTNEFDENIPFWQAVRRYPKVAGWFVSLTTVVVGWGFDLVIIGSITGVEAFQRDYGEMYEGRRIIPSVWLSLWTAATPLGMSIASIFAGWFQDRFGRRYTLMLGSIISGIAVALIFCSYLPPDINGMRVMFTLGKLIQGFSVGMLKVTAMTYMSENAPVALRGSAMGLVPAGNLLGQLLGAVLIYAINDIEGNTGYLSAFGVQWILAIVPFVISVTIPESPSYLLNRDMDEAASRAAERLYAPRTNAQEALVKLRATIAEEKAMVSSDSYLQCFNAQNRRRTIIVLLANLYPALFGLDLIGRSSYFLQTMGMDSGLSLMLLIVGIVLGFLANATGVWVMARVPRRPVIMISFSATAILWLSMSIAGFWQGPVGNENPTVYYYTAACIMTIIVAVGLGAWPGTYAVVGEASSLRMRSKTQGLGGVSQQASSVVVSVVLPFVYNLDAGALGARTGFFFVGTCIVAIIGTYFLLPEMKGRTAAELDAMFLAKVPTRKFSQWKNEDNGSVEV